MKRYSTIAVVTFITFSMLNCGGTRVISDHDPSVDFKAYKTFVVCADDLVVKNVAHGDFDNPQNRQKIYEASALAMTQKGFTKVEENPELQVGFKMLVEEEDFQVSNCHNGEPINYWEECTIENITFTEHTVIVYLTDLKQDQIVWQASHSQVEVSPGRMSRALPTIVEDLFAELPY